MIDFIEQYLGVSSVVGFLLIVWGCLLMVVPNHEVLNVIGLTSYYVGVYQWFVHIPD